MKINFAQATDLNSIQTVIETAFSDEENKSICELAANLLRETTNPPIKSLVTTLDDQAVGYVS